MWLVLQYFGGCWSSKNRPSLQSMQFTHERITQLLAKVECTKGSEPCLYKIRKDNDRHSLAAITGSKRGNELLISSRQLPETRPRLALFQTKGLALPTPA
ncbi:hypothetical protein H0G86_003827 [Trichoderma simmonsii]|uniref:Uncharacterized protein n=1 Tax=Trichoderma simmonsii TaxID=1491479 RepID=A0A8G0PHC9_9HYPO|nr:hypothetical protein H0G86_003827 [Trichoderma simmonsii]